MALKAPESQSLCLSSALLPWEVGANYGAAVRRLCAASSTLLENATAIAFEPCAPLGGVGPLLDLRAGLAQLIPCRPVHECSATDPRMLLAEVAECGGDSYLAESITGCTMEALPVIARVPLLLLVD